MALQRVHPDDLALVQQTIDRAASDGKNFDHEHRLLMPDGSVKQVHVVAHATSDDSGRVEFVGAVTDVTIVKQAEKILRRSEIYLHEAQRLGHVGSWASGPSSGAFSASPELFRIFGCDPDERNLKRKIFREQIHPEDFPSFEETVEKARSEKTGYDFDYRIVLPDG